MNNAIRLSAPLAVSADLILAAATAALADINYSSITDPSNLTFVGNGHLENGVLRMSPLASAGWYTTKQGVTQGFTTTFKFRCSGQSDGFAFLVRNMQVNAICGGGGDLGYADCPPETPGISNSIALQFDYWQNLPGDMGIPSGDPSNNWMSTQSRGTLANSADVMYSLGWTTNTLRSMTATFTTSASPIHRDGGRCGWTRSSVPSCQLG